MQGARHLDGHPVSHTDAAIAALAAGCDMVLLCNQSLNGGQAVDELIDGLVPGFINPAAFDAAGIPDHRVANPRHSGAMAVVRALCSGRQQPLGANVDL